VTTSIQENNMKRLFDWLRRYIIGESWQSQVEAYRDLFWGLIADVEREDAALAEHIVKG
jgi:hypothetical protein